ncbi:MAG TPA: helix-turn-helix domain-containing protein [Vicinamibacterales bacterium]|nr:helix-turn-helix domain-containing protein [Vicinamibacterales bacterium]
MDTHAAILFLSEVCQELRISLTTAKRLRRAGAFPIPELPSLDKRARFSSRDVDAFKAREGSVRARRRA